MCDNRALGLASATKQTLRALLKGFRVTQEGYLIRQQLRAAEVMEQGQVCSRESKQEIGQWWKLQMSDMRSDSFGNEKWVMDVMIGGMLKASTSDEGLT